MPSWKESTYPFFFSLHPKKHTTLTRQSSSLIQSHTLLSLTTTDDKLASPPATTTLNNVVSLTSAVLGMAIISSSTEPSPSPVEAVERVIGYRFKDKSLINQALTHCSTLVTPDSVASPSYERLEFIGDAALGLALANFAFIKYPHLDPHQLSLLRSANLSTEKLARVAIRHGFFNHLLHSSPPLHLKVREFTLAIQQEEEGDEEYYYGGEYLKAPKVLADIVESIAAAIYVDSDYNLKLLWEVYRPLLEPIVKLENLQQQPITMLYEACQKQGKRVDFRQFRKGQKIVYAAIVDGKILGTGCSEQKDIAKLNAAKGALQTINNLESSMDINDPCVANGLPEISEAKQKLKMFCDKKHWPNPMYRVNKEVGPAHDKRFICSVHVETPDGVYMTLGDIRAKVKDGETSAASMMLHSLNETTLQVKPVK